MEGKNGIKVIKVIHVFAGGLKTGPIFKRFADMCDKRTRWIHCYLQSFVHFQCSLHGHADSQIFIANLRQKKIIKFSKHAFREGFVHFLSQDCSTCFFVFDLSNCQGGVGWGGGG